MKKKKDPVTANWTRAPGTKLNSLEYLRKSVLMTRKKEGKKKNSRV